MTSRRPFTTAVVAVALLAFMSCGPGLVLVAALASPSPLTGYHFGANTPATAKKVTAADLRRDRPRSYVPDGLTEEQYRQIKEEELAKTQSMNFGM